MQEMPHIPVLLEEVIECLAPEDGGIYVDGTFGAGGYSRAILEKANCSLYAIDRDQTVEKFAKPLMQQYPDNMHLLIGNFGDMDKLLEQREITAVNGIVLDVGVSSMQLDTADRGFSFMQDGPLDMRMGSDGIDASYVVNNTPEGELADIIYKYGDERKSRRVAKAIIQARQENEITTTGRLASIVRSVVRGSKDAIDPATRTFQALRIWVNDELGELERALDAAERILVPGGRLVVVSFHSLEDSIVKSFLKKKSGRVASVSRHAPVFEDNKTEITFDILTRKAIKPSDKEIGNNIRARSARLRAGVRCN